MTFTPEQIYQIYFKETFKHKHGFYPKPITHWEKYTNQAYWPVVVRFTDMVNNNAGQINPNIYITALVKSYDGVFDVTVLTSPKSIKIFKNYVEMLNCNTDDIVALVYDNLHYIASFCNEHKITNLDGYLKYGCDILPAILKHYNAGSVTKYTISIIPSIGKYFKLYPQDVVNEYLKNLESEYINVRLEIIRNPKLAQVSDHMFEIIEKLIKKENA